MSCWRVELADATGNRTEWGITPQGLKPAKAHIFVELNGTVG